MWCKLLKLFERSDEESKAAVMEELLTAKYERGSSIASHISKLENIFHRLRTLSPEVGDDLLISKILSTLPENLNHFKTSWRMSASTHQTLENLITDLITEEDMKETPSEQNLAFLAENKRCSRCAKANHSAKFCKLKDKLKCEVCGYKGHVGAVCKTKNGSIGQNGQKCNICKKTNHSTENHRFKEKPGEKQDKKVSVSFSVYDENFSENLESKTWILDSGTTSHVTNNLSMLTKVVETKDKIGTAKKGNEIEVRAIGQLTGQHYNLKNVLYSPDFSNNLMSVAAVVDGGGEVIFSKNGVAILINGKKLRVENEKKMVYLQLK